MIFLASMENSNYLCNIILELLSVCCIDVWLDCTVGNEFTKGDPLLGLLPSSSILAHK